METQTHTFGDARMRATVAAQGAELVALNAGGEDVLWDAGKAWRRHSPVLFPIVGRLPDDTALINGKSYHLTQHGFARDRRFRWVETRDDGCVLELESDEKTLAVFPFHFRLWLDYRVQDGRLTVTYTLRNMEEGRELFASLGAHPAFRWPLRKDEDREAYRLTFEEAEPEPIRRLEGGLLAADSRPTPIKGRELALKDALFEDDAIIMDRVRSRSVVFGKPGSRGLRVAWNGFPQLGIWTKPGAHFLCIEPWHGFASPHGFHGEFRDKPGQLCLQPQQEWSAFWSVEAVDA